MKHYRISTVKEFIKELFDRKIVEAVLIPFKTLKGKTSHPFIVKSCELIEKFEPFSEEMPINMAKEVSRITFKGALPFKTAVFLKPCELRALRELAKLNQVNLENLITVSFDCEGVKSSKDGEKRDICKMCVNFTPDFADIKILRFGTNEMVVETSMDLPFEEMEFSGDNREKAIEKILKENSTYREERLKEVRERFQSLLKNCIVCHNCMRVCPVCFCQECFFESPALKSDSITYISRSTRLKGVDFPENKLLFHLGRMNHMSLICVNCGVCEENCPADVPVAQMFAASGDEVKKLFNYEPGRDLSEPIPFTCYKHEELKDFEKEYK